MRKIIQSSALALIITCSAFAGEIHNPYTPPDPPSTGNSVQEPVGGEIPNPQPTENIVTEITLNLLTSVISLL